MLRNTDISLGKLSLSSPHKNHRRICGFYVVPGQGFEPRYPGPKPGVLPLDDPGKQIFFKDVALRV